MGLQDLLQGELYLYLYQNAEVIFSKYISRFRHEISGWNTRTGTFSWLPSVPPRNYRSKILEYIYQLLPPKCFPVDHSQPPSPSTPQCLRNKELLAMNQQTTHVHSRYSILPLLFHV
jgi:hypothetical protein